MRSTVTRRRFLAGATVLGAAVAAGCSLGSHPTGPPSEAATPPIIDSPEPDESLLRAAVADMAGLLATAIATIRSHPGLAGQLRPLTGVVNQQLAVLGSADRGERATATTIRPTTHQIPEDPNRARTELRHRTSRTTLARLDDTLRAESGPFARVLASMSAGLSEQAVRLGGPALLGSVPTRGAVDRDDARRLQAALAAENAAVYAYGVIGARGGEPRLATARLGYEVHLERRDVLTSMIRAPGVIPAAALPGYDLPGRLTRPAAVARFANTVELRCCEVYAEVVSETTADARGFCAVALASCGNWSVAWGQAPQPFPGAPEL